MGDASHQARKSDHNDGNAFDITIDEARATAGTGPVGDELAAQALEDPRSTYVIWNRQIKSKAREAEGWRTYDGPNPHTKHVHVSINAAMRDDDSPWPWASQAPIVARAALAENPVVKFGAFTVGAVIGAALLRALLFK
jgi:hypothetical protein